MFAAGLEARWQTPHACRTTLPAETLLVSPSDPHFDAGFADLIKTLTIAGVDQIVAPNGLAERTAAYMLQSPTRLGLVLDEREWTGDNQLADAPTAIILPDDNIVAQAFVDRISDFRAHSVSPLLVVARPERVLRGRRLDQTISRFAPYA